MGGSWTSAPDTFHRSASLSEGGRCSVPSLRRTADGHIHTLQVKHHNSWAENCVKIFSGWKLEAANGDLAHRVTLFVYYVPFRFTHACSREIRRILWHILCTAARWHAACRDTVPQSDRRRSQWSRTCRSHKAGIHYYKQLQGNGPTLCKTGMKFWAFQNRTRAQSTPEKVFYLMTSARGHYFLNYLL